MGKSSLSAEKINTKVNGVRKESRKIFYESKEKMKKGFRLKPTIENVEDVRLIWLWKKGTTLFVGDSMLAGNLSNNMLHFGTNNSVIQTSRKILNRTDLKSFIEKLCPTCKIRVLNIIY